MIIKKKLILIGLTLFVTVLCIQNVFALTANSSNYSVSMFGMGMLTGSFSSSSYNVTFLSEVKGTTRGAGSDLHTVNIGFFDDTTYYRTVSITSYSIYPASVVVGSTIGLYISALNFQSVWAEITSPSGYKQIVPCVNDQFVSYTTLSVAGTYDVVFYANSSVGAIASAVDSFVLTEEAVVTPPSDSGGSGSETVVIEKCTYLWDCTPWGVCADGKQKRICTNAGTCNGTESKPSEEMECSYVLFDIALKLRDVKITKNETLKFSVDLIEKMGVDKIDVYIKYSIMEEGYEIFSQIETKAVQKSLFYEKEIEEVKLVDGEYILRVDIFYGNLQRAFAEQRFEIKDGKLLLVSEGGWVVSKLLIIFGILILVITLIVFVLIKLMKEKKIREDSGIVHLEGVGQRLKRVGIENNLVAILSFIVVGFLFVVRKSLIGFVISDSAIERGSWNLFGFVLLVGLFGLLIFLCRSKIKVFVERAGEKIKSRYPKNSIGGLVKKKVYTDEGDYFGKVEEVIMGDCKIDSLNIKLSKIIKKKNEIKNKGVVVKYNDVKNVGHVVIIKGRVLGQLSKS